MLYRNLFCLFLLLLTIGASAQHNRQKPLPVIFDSDIGPDYDDAGAITILHALADKGEAKILATIACNKYEGIAGILNVFNTYFGRPNIPIGVPKGDAVKLRDRQHWTDTLLAKYPHKMRSNSEAADAVTLYRQILAKAPDHSITIISVGFLTNLANLLNSPADNLSSLNGLQLVQKKVKQLVSMAGGFVPGKPYREFNIIKDAKSAQIAFSNWPTPVIFCGFEIGARVKAGIPLIQNPKLKGPTKDVFRISIPQAKQDSLGRMSWDEITVLTAIQGFEPFYTLKPGKIKIADDGLNTWDDKAVGQFYMVQAEPTASIQAVIEQLISYQPKK